MSSYRRVAVGVVLGVLAGGPACAADLDLSVTDLRDANGRVMIAVFNAATTFLKDDQQVAAAILPANGAAVRVVFDLPPGRYAVSVFHDANRNGKLDSNLVGMPTEGYGFSRGARGTMGPPAFDAAAFDLPAGGTRQPIKLGY
ncbi:DUF2141 domain-containing protein [Reyranella sp. CPCC 100927]|uniref:DUF2141 domain-containing protein n=1 Tax=Reyranella sp. CPCC 100927 TaxID=2599616 RepID=UPI0011B7CB4F|nr:DUF2141 domain-containing protein [Reyranella sp. CPCC 100927]TWT03984.1 DUF2141 domain-containing protein [Reyranella sp. CPCC 100927]